MTDIDTIQADINAIREALWRGHGQQPGRAAVMVGSGFSFNARPRRVGVKFPDWRTFAEPFLNRLAGGAEDRLEELRSQAKSPAGILQLLEEYQAAFGRTALDQTVKDIIPDKDFDPGDLHKTLLELPWADVFTTNYDRLLERAAEEIYSRKYEEVYKQEELAHAVRPRIVKLHGSLHHNTPFILTEEDYRTYPQQFSLFVNTVQQALTENLFCLIGFSGNDPNFLQWIGWVRDRLGQNAPRIYLCGLLNLRVGQERRLLKMGVIPVDLSRLPQMANIRGGERHYKAMEWLLENFKNGEGYKASEWPELSSEISHFNENWPIPMPEGFPKKFVRPPSFENSLIPAQNPDSNGDNVRDYFRQFNELIKIWDHNWKLYPGWWVFPAEHRPMLMSVVRELAYSLTGLLSLWRELQNMTTRRPEEDKSSFHETLMQAICLYCRYSDLVMTSFSEQLLVLVSIFLEDLQQKPSNQLSDNQYSQWLESAVWLLKNYRERLDCVQFNDWLQRIQNFKRLQVLPEYDCILIYCESLLALETIDIRRFAQSLENMMLTDHSGEPYSSIWYAALLAEAGRYQAAGNLIEKTAVYIQKRSSPGDRTFFMRSREAWAFLGWWAYLGEQFKSKRKPIEQRWNQLWLDRCHARDELEYFRQDAREACARLLHQHKDIIGIKYEPELMVCLRFLRMMDKVGLVYRVCDFEIYQNDVIDVARVLLNAEAWASRGIGLILRIAPRSGWPPELAMALQILPVVERTEWLQRGWASLPGLARQSTDAFADLQVHRDGRNTIRLHLVCVLLAKLFSEHHGDQSSQKWWIAEHQKRWPILRESYQHLGFNPEQQVGWNGLNLLLAAMLPGGGGAPLDLLCDLLTWFPLEQRKWGWKDPILALDAKNCPFIYEPENDKTGERWNKEREILQLSIEHPEPSVAKLAAQRKERFIIWGILHIPPNNGMSGLKTN